MTLLLWSLTSAAVQQTETEQQLAVAGVDAHTAAAAAVSPTAMMLEESDSTAAALQHGLQALAIAELPRCDTRLCTMQCARHSKRVYQTASDPIWEVQTLHMPQSAV